MRRGTVLVSLFAAFSVATCSASDPPAASNADILLADLVGCYSFESLPDSVYALATDLDWPTVIELTARTPGDGSSGSYWAEALDPVWGSIASPHGRALRAGPDSVVFDWGVTSFRVRASGGGRLDGVATIEAAASEVVATVSGMAVSCPQ